MLRLFWAQSPGSLYGISLSCGIAIAARTGRHMVRRYDGAEYEGKSLIKSAA